MSDYESAHIESLGDRVGRRSFAAPRFALLVLAGVLIMALQAPAPVSATALPGASPDPWMIVLHASQGLHTWRLRLAGSTVRALPDEQLQTAANDCALSVIRQLQRQAGRALTPYPVLDTLLQRGPHGVTLDRLAYGLQILGFRARVTRVAAENPERVALDSLARSLPAVALLKPGHYVLLTELSSSHAEFFDPLVGLVHQPLARFRASWTGKAVQLPMLTMQDS